MRYLKTPLEIINENQIKKLKKYFTYSVVLDWYRKSQNKIAQTLGCNVSDLADEETLIEQSQGLVNFVINSQVNGNDGNNSTSGFAAFDKLEKNLIHDILHNMYNVQAKEFRKSLTDLDFTESEIFEEIEVLAIEESFMKNMNIKYLKTDFINQNMNQLASYMMMSILKNDPERIRKILDEEVDPYIEIYGKQYPVADTPLENFFSILNNREADSEVNGRDSDRFKSYMIHLINVGIGIDQSSGDRANYPNDNYYGEKDFEDLDEDEKIDAIDKYIEDNTWNSSYSQGVIITDRRNKEDEDDHNAPYKYTMNIIEMQKAGYEFYRIKANPKQTELFAQDEDEDDIRINDTFTKIPMKGSFVDEQGDVDISAWLDFMADNYDLDSLMETVKGDRYIVLERNYNNNIDFGVIYRVIDSNYMDYATYDHDHEFVNKDKYEEESFEDIAHTLCRNEQARAIMRRNFRLNDVIVNNTKLGDDTKSEDIYDFSASDYNSGKSLSKNTFTENGKKLYFLLNDLKGYFIKNIENIKTDHKEKSTLFSKHDIEIFKGLDFKKMSMNIKSGFDMYLTIGSRPYGTKIGDIVSLIQLYQLSKKVNSSKDIDFLFNYVNKNSFSNKVELKNIFDTVRNMNLDQAVLSNDKINIPEIPDEDEVDDIVIDIEKDIERVYNIKIDVKQIKMVGSSVTITFTI